MLHKMRIAKHPFLASCIVAIWFWAPIWELRGVPLWTSGSAVGGVAAASGPITYVGATANNFSATRTPTISYPTSEAGDIFILAFALDTVGVFDGTPPSGWTKLRDYDDGAADTTGAIFWKRSTGSESGVWTNLMAATETGIAACLVFRNCVATGSPFNTNETPIAGGAVTAHNCPTTTTTVDGCMVVGVLAIDPGAGTRTYTWDAGWTERIGLSTTPSGMNSAVGALYIGTRLIETAAAAIPGGDFDTAESAAKFTFSLTPQ
jgi:hypothetical protein